MLVTGVFLPDPFLKDCCFLKHMHVSQVNCLPVLFSLSKNTDWNKYDDRLMKAVERGEVDKVSATLSKKGVVPTKLNVEGQSA